jgi:segregation and condensation protein B
MNELEMEPQAPEETPESESASSGEAEAVAPSGVDGEPSAEPMAAEQLGLLDKPEAGDSETARIKAVLEAVVYVTDEPLSPAQIAQGLGLSKERVETLLEDLVTDYNQPHRGLTVREVAGGYKMSTKAEVHDEIRSFVKKLRPPLKLSLPALETLAVIAYKQPVTAPEIMDIRGVQGAGVLKTLMERKLITTAGRKQVVGKPVLYKTTKDFLIQFGLKDLAELPTLKEFEEWSRLAVADAEVEVPAESAAETSSTAEPEVPQAETEAVATADLNSTGESPSGAQEEESQPTPEATDSEPEA